MYTCITSIYYLELIQWNSKIQWSVKLQQQQVYAFFFFKDILKILDCCLVVTVKDLIYLLY